MSKIAVGLFCILLLMCSCTTKIPTETAEKYIVTSPEIAEIICLLESGDKIIGVTAECDYPAYLQKRQIVGNFGKVNIEKIIELNPSIVFTAGLEQEILALELSKLNIKTNKIHVNSIENLYYSILEIGKRINKKKRASFIIDSLKIEMQNIPRFRDKTRVYLEIYSDPIMSVSDSSFVGKIVEFAGANNIFASLPRDYSRIDPENVILANPQIIILTYPGVSKQNIKDRKGWEVISAIKNDRIYSIDEINPDLILRATPRFIAGIKMLQRIFYETK